MKAIVVKPHVPDSIHMHDMPDPVDGTGRRRRQDDQGRPVCDRRRDRARHLRGGAGRQRIPHPRPRELRRGRGRRPPRRRVGRPAISWSPTVRRPCGVCPHCKAGENDMCSSGQYTERGIMRRHGFMAEYYAESPNFCTRIPKSIRDVAVLLEPLSVVEKGLDHTYLLQRRMRGWKPRLGMALGAGPIGLLGAAVMRARGLRTVVVGREAADRRARADRDSSSAPNTSRSPAATLADVVKAIGEPDLIARSDRQLAGRLDAMQILDRNGVLCLLSVTSGDHASVPANLINQRLVLGNQVVVGSVNANPRHFDAGVKDFVAIEKKWPGVLQTADGSHPVAGPQDVVRPPRRRDQGDARNQRLQPRRPVCHFASRVPFRSIPAHPFVEPAT